ncbi:MAG: adenylate kinase [Campylobacteraceae bacterium 4484_166]|nr:MAG: adenylate kinase [Campylobacteraceae bacterium 4484_166]
MKKLFLIIGAPGSGKTTDAEMIAQNNENITHYSTGDMFREQIASKSELGAIINKYVSAGNLVPIDIVIKTIVDALNKAPTNVVIIDGYPRSNEQMIELDNYLNNDTNIKLVSVIEVVVSEETACDRVLGRARGEDDNVEIFNNRMKVYNQPLEDIQNFYQTKNLLHKVDGERTINEIVKDIQKHLEQKGIKNS